MHLSHISLTDFRGFSRLDLDIPREIFLLVGENAQGKTTILEAIYFLSTLTSFHAGSDRELINFSSPVNKLIREPNGDNGRSRFRKEVLVDGVKRKLNEVVGFFNAVIFLPQMARIIEEGPSERRRYLDMLISQVSSQYVKHLSEYGQTLLQRNALLKQLAERGGEREQLAVWDGMLARHGAIIMQERIRTIREIEEEAKRLHYDLTHGNEVLRLDYQPAYDPLEKHDGQMTLDVSTIADRSGFSQDDIEKGRDALHCWR